MSHPSNKITLENAGEIVKYHAPTQEQIKAHSAVADAAENMLCVILKYVPDCADRSTAIRCVREAKMWASAAVALELTEEKT